MDNQHRKIAGYRELSQDEIDLMNEIKEQGKVLSALVDKVNACNTAHSDSVLVADSKALRSGAIAATDLQTGLMWLTRAVAKPEFF